MRRTFTGVLCVVVLWAVLPNGVAWGREYAPRVVSPHVADAYSMKTFRRFHRWAHLEGDQLAWAVYCYLADTRTGLFHMNEVLEGTDVLSEYRTVRDPVKIINVYGYGYCGIFGPVMAGVCCDMGLGPARTLVLPEWNHVACEAFYDDRWHYLDVDVRAVFRRPDGTLASMAEAKRDPSLWTGRGPLFFPNDPLEKTREIYRRTKVYHFHGFNQSGHTMDYVLRQGESFTRWWTPQGGRWHHVESYHRSPWLRKLLEQPPRGPKPNHRHFTVHNYGNGRFVYRPNLTSRSTDFADGVWQAVNVQPDGEGLTLSEPGSGFAVFEVRSPYVIVPVVGRMESVDDDRQASVVEVDASGARLAVSLDGGLSWHRVAVTRWPAQVDLTRLVAGSYGYLLRISLEGRPHEAVVRSLCITTWVQVAPASLPALGKGKNRMEYRTGDHYGLNTRVREIASDASTPEGFFKYLAEPVDDYDPGRKTARIRGPVVVRVDPPPAAQIVWFCAAGSFRTHLHEAASNTRNTIEYAVDRPEHFTEIYRAAVPTDTEHWHYNAYREVRLDRPARRLFVRYVGDPALNNFRIYAHCLDDGRRSTRPVFITHTWRENGETKKKVVSLSGPGTYEVVTEDEPENVSVEIAVPSDGPQSHTGT